MLRRVLMGAMVLALTTGCGSGGSDASAPAAAGAPSTVAGSPAPMSVVVSHGHRAVGRPGCTESSCTYVTATLSGFDASVPCSISSASWPTGTQGFVTWRAGDGTTQSPNYAGYRGKGYTVTVTCGGVASKAFAW